MEWQVQGNAAVGYATGVTYLVARDGLGWFFAWEFDPPSLGGPGTVTCRAETLEAACDAAEQHWRTH
jgi:hypothetical protein